MQSKSLLTSVLALCVTLPLIGADPPPGNQPKRPMFLPKPLDDEWSKWLVGQWETTGQTDTGSGKGTVRIELALNGQFRLHTEEGTVTEMTPDQERYLKRNMHASDEEIARFKAAPYRALEIYTTDQVTGDTIGYLFDSLRCIATGRGTRKGNTETVHWQWATGHKSTRITQRAGPDKLTVTQQTPMPDGSIMQEKGHATRKK